MTDRPLTPEEKAYASYLMGSGLYNAMQLKQILTAPPLQEAENVLKIRVPKERLQEALGKQADINIGAAALNMLAGPMRTGLSAASGFKDASRQYVEMEKHRLQTELDQAEAEYLETLQKLRPSAAKMASANDTPCFDAFCRGVLSTISMNEDQIKQAAEGDADINDGALMRTLQDKVVGPIRSPFDPAINTVGGTAAAATLGTALAVYLLKQKLEEKKPEKTQPTRVELEAV